MESGAMLPVLKERFVGAMYDKNIEAFHRGVDLYRNG
jgi:hypothetical protein